MRNWTKAAGLLFLAASSVYSEGVLRAAGADKAKPAKGPAEVTPLDDAAPATPATQPAAQPATQPSADAAAPAGLGSQTVSVKEAGTVEVHVNDASLIEVLKMLSIQSQKNIIASKEVRGTVTASLYEVTVKEALDAILKANGFDYREKGNFIFVYSQKELAEMEKAMQVKKTEMFRLYYTPAANAANMIKPVLSGEAAVSFTTPAKVGLGGAGGAGAGGGAGGGDDVGGNDHATEDLLVVTDFPERLDQVRAILKEVDRRPQQILVEATILRASLQENNDLGIDFTVLGGVDFNSLGALGGAAPAAGGVDQLLSGSIVNNPAAGGITDSGAFAGRAGGSGLKLGFIKNNVGAFLTALEGVTDTVVMANPKVLVLNKQRGQVLVGSQQGYRTAVSTETLTADDVKFLETGTKLAFRPYVGDNGFVRMEIHPEDSSGSVNAQGLPNKFVTQVTSNVMVKDGHTIVIGGLFRESTDRTRSQVPGLGSLPGIGAAFRRQTDATVREEVIILLTPRIVKDESAYAAAGEEQLKHAERLRVGVRTGLMPWGRERLAETWYEKAQSELRKENPDRQKALWYLNSATNLNPKFSEAIELKSRVTGQEAAAVDNSAVRRLMSGLMAAEKGREVPYSSDTPPATVPSLDRAARGRDQEMREAAAAAAAGPATQPAQLAVAPADLPATRPAATRPAEPATAVTELPVDGVE